MEARSRLAGFLDELGLSASVSISSRPGTMRPTWLRLPLELGNDRGEEKYREHRARLLYVPFENVHTRRIWGAGNPQSNSFSIKSFCGAGLDLRFKC